MSWWTRARNQWRARPLADDLDEEIAFHLRERVEANLRAGLSRTDAEAEARRHFGNVAAAREGMWEARTHTWWPAFVRDTKHGIRVLRRQPGATALALLTLSLGIGANAAIFSLVQAALFRPLPYQDPHQLVSLVDADRVARGRTSPTIPEVLEVRELNQTLSSVSFFDTRDFQISGGNEPERVFVARVEPAFLALLGARAALGRLIGPGDSQDGAAPAVVLSDGLWRRNFGGNPSVIGRTLLANGASHAIIGVLESGFSLDDLSGQSIDMFVAYPMNAAYTSRSAEFANVRRVTGVGRLRSGIDLQAASADLQAIGQRLAASYPATYGRSGQGTSTFVMDVEGLRDAVVGGNRSVVWLLASAVVLVLFIACVNAAQFLLAQAVDRETEVAVRAALGASRGRLIRQFLTEAFLLAGLAAAIGFVQAFWLTDLLRALLPAGSPVVRHVDVDVTVLAFTAGIAIVTAAAVGIVPALRFSHARPGLALGSRGATSHHSGARQLFIAAEVAISLVLLVAAGLLLRTLHDLQRSQSGFSAAGVTAMRMRGIGGGPVLGTTYQRYLRELTALPGLEVAAVTSGILPGRAGVPFSIVGSAETEAVTSRQVATYQIVSGSYFSTLQIPIRSGRAFADDDMIGRPAVAIVNEELAQTYWPGETAIGKVIRAGDGPRNATMTIVGVVDNVRTTVQPTDVPQIYVSYLQQSEPNITLLVRSKPGALSVEAIKQAIWRIEPRQAVFDVRSLDDVVRQSVSGQRTMAVLLGSFALLALVISVTGVYTVVTYLVSRRVREIAVRRAIGAGPADIVWLLAGQTLRWTAVGLAIGVVGAIASSRGLVAAVPGVRSLDISTIATVASLYLLVVFVAAMVPTLRALAVDPVAALRAE
jgi:putative ABC transport system permease protein